MADALDAGKSRWQREFDALPSWAQKMVRATTTCASYGSGDSSSLLPVSHPERYSAFVLGLEREAFTEWFDGFCEMRDLAAAITAPWPPPPPPAREKQAFNIVELMDDEQAFDQPCAFGNRCGDHAVYCHNEAWPNSPRKCRRSQSDPEHKHEDCPGFVANPEAELGKAW